MTQFFTEEGKVVPVTLINAGPVTITQMKTVETDGYTAVQVAYGDQKKERMNKAALGHLKAPFAHVKEFRVKSGNTLGEHTVGSTVDLSVFAPGDVITVTGTSKSKGFQGVVKRHNFKGGPRTHGQKHSEREPGSIGGGLRTRVPKGMRMGGRMGGDRVCVKNLKVVAIDAKNNQLLVSGAVPGRKGTLLEIVG